MCVFFVFLFFWGGDIMPSQPVRLYQGDKVKADQLISADDEIGEKDDGGQDKMLRVIRVQRCRKG